jgi:hypothetical protein
MSFNTCGIKLEVRFKIKGLKCIIVGFYIDVDTGSCSPFAEEER